MVWMGRVFILVARTEPQATAVKLAQLGEGCRGQANVINLKRILNGKQNVWKYQNGEEKSDSDGREKDV